MRRLKWLLIISFTLILVIASSGLVRHHDVNNTEPLSVRNNNPVNIKYTPHNQWKGSVYQSGTFEKFESKYFGLRAGVIVIQANIKATDSVKGFVLRFATEPFETEHNINIRNYIKHLEDVLGYKGKIKLEDTLKVLKVIIQREGGLKATEYYNTKG